MTSRSLAVALGLIVALIIGAGALYRWLVPGLSSARPEPGPVETEVATWLDLEPIALVRMLDKLNEEGLVERRAHPTDRRVRTLWLTPAARLVVTQILAINKTIRDEAFGGMPTHARDTVIDILDAIKGNLALREEADDSPTVPPAETDRADQHSGRLAAADG